MMLFEVFIDVLPQFVLNVFKNTISLRLRRVKRKLERVQNEENTRLLSFFARFRLAQVYEGRGTAKTSDGWLSGAQMEQFIHFLQEVDSGYGLLHHDCSLGN